MSEREGGRKRMSELNLFLTFGTWRKKEWLDSMELAWYVIVVTVRTGSTKECKSKFTTKNTWCGRITFFCFWW